MFSLVHEQLSHEHEIRKEANKAEMHWRLQKILLRNRLVKVPICIIIISETVIGRNLQIESAFFGRGCSVHLKKEFLINNNEKD